MRPIDADKLMVEIMDSDLDHLQRDDWKEVIQIVQDAPTIQPHWIPVTERLPEDDGTYIVCLTDGSVFEYDYLVRWAEKWTYIGKEVTAWMPLPEPYKEGQE